MHDARVRILFCIFLLLPSWSYAQPSAHPPKYEVRAVWLATLAGIDWPHSRDTREQQEALRQIIRNLKEKNFNTIFFQVRPRGNAFYRSRYEPWAQELTGTAGKDPGWDPMQFLLTEAHAAGMEVHAWFNMAKVYGDGHPQPSRPAHVIDAHPSWVKKSGHEWWLDLGIPAVREYLKNIVLDMVRMYDVDGVHFDYLRYPDAGLDDGDAYRAQGGGLTRDDWRRSNLDRFVTDVYRSLKKQKPHLKIGSAPIGLFAAVNGVPSDFTGYAGVYQDARGWLRKGVQDYLVPQLYWDLGNDVGKKDPDFEQLCAEWSRNGHGRHIYAGIGVYKKKILKEVEDQIIVSRSAGAKGQALFRYSHLETLDDRLSAYRFPALIPPMPWIDSIPPLPPATVGDVSSGVLRWNHPTPARDGDLPKKYVVYRSSAKSVDIGDPRNIIAVLSGAATSFVDRGTNGRNDSYVVTSLDACNNESRLLPAPTAVAAISRSEPRMEKNGMSHPATPAPRMEKKVTSLPAAPAPHMSVPLRSVPALVHRATDDTLCLLAQNYPEPFTGKTFIIYELAVAGHARLVVMDLKTGKETPVVDAQQERGTYIALFSGTNGDEVEYECRLELGGALKKIVMKKR